MLANDVNGILITNGAENNTIGGVLAADRNTISGNLQNGIRISGPGTTGNAILGNFIGTDVSGTLDLGNTDNGVLVEGGSNGTTIGGVSAGDRNILSGNDGNGVKISGASGTITLGNHIGVDVSGTLNLGNTGNGIHITEGAFNSRVGGENAGARNVISGNDLNGVLIDGVMTTSTVVLGNYIGTDVTGSQAQANRRGVDIDGVGSVELRNNVISGNLNANVQIRGTGATDNLLVGNTIGLDVGGTTALGFTDFGVSISDGARDNVLMDNVISGNGFLNVSVVGGSGNRVQGNLIGTDATGTAAPMRSLVPTSSAYGLFVQNSSDNLIGGATAEARNVISNNGAGVALVSSMGNLVKGNYIGTDITGTVALGNGVGVDIRSDSPDLPSTGNVVGGTDAGARNVISGNSTGVSIEYPGTTQNVVAGNYIGTDTTGTAPLGNTQRGVYIFHTTGNNVIGGTAPGAGNVIAYNGGAGVLIGNAPFNPPAGSGNSVLGNAIFSNGGLGIDLGAAGSITPNDPDDADTGPNDLLNFPVLTSAVLGGGDVLVTGSINTEKFKTLRIEFFTNTVPDTSGHGEGEIFIGFLVVEMGDNNTVNFEVLLQGDQVEPGQFITATATDELGNTSEFSLALAVL